MKLLFVVLFALSLSESAGGLHPKTFTQAKKAAAKLYHDHQQTFYCGCEYYSQNKKLRPKLESCGYKARKSVTRANRIEWEHIVPAWVFGHQLQCWQNGGRSQCRKDSLFNQIESDLHNLVPAIGEINGDRSNFNYAMIAGETRNYGQCDFEIDFKSRTAEPRPEVRGDIARTYFYMAQRYNLSISAKQKRLLTVWARQDPIDDWEVERDKRIARIQGNHNPFIIEAAPDQRAKNTTPRISSIAPDER